MTNLESLRALQARIREAKGADRELDVLIDEHLAGKWRGLTAENVACIIEASKPRYDSDGVPCGPTFNIPPYTTDPDGLGPCVSLIEEILPGYSWSVSGNKLRMNGVTGFANISPPYGYDGPAPWPEGHLHHDNRCIALLYSGISAKISELEATEKADV